MSLTRRQMNEIAALDWKRRTGRNFDGRRYGSVTLRRSQCWTEAYRCDFSGKKPPRKTLRYNYIEKRGKDVTVVHVAVRLDGAYRQVVKDVCRFHPKTGLFECGDIDYRGIAGWIVFWDRDEWKPAKRCVKLPAVRHGRHLYDGWWKGGKWKFGGGLGFPHHETVNLDALKGTRYEWCQYNDDRKIGLIDWLMLYRMEPKVELLAKAGLDDLINPAGLNALKDKRIFNFVREHVSEISNRDFSVREILYAARHGVSFKDASKRFAFVNNMKYYLRGYRGGDLRSVRVDYDRLMKLIPKWKCSNAEYARYLEYSHDVGYDLRNVGTLYPPVKGGRKAFMARLEKLEELVEKKRRADARRARAALRKAREAERARAEAEAKWLRDTVKVRAAELEAFQKSLKRTDVLKGCGYTLIVAKSQKELLAEGRKMGNCVGNGLYGRGVVMGDRLIIMVKLAGKSFCDIEIRRADWQVRQCYLKGNDRAPAAMHRLARKIASALKKEWLRHKKRGLFKELERKAA